MEKPQNERESTIFDHFLTGPGLFERFHTASTQSGRNGKCSRRGDFGYITYV